VTFVPCLDYLCIVIPYLRFFRVFPSVVRQMPGYNTEKTGHAPHL
jgi:hypothetical protein